MLFKFLKIKQILQCISRLKRASLCNLLANISDLFSQRNRCLYSGIKLVTYECKRGKYFSFKGGKIQINKNQILNKLGIE